MIQNTYRDIGFEFSDGSVGVKLFIVIAVEGEIEHDPSNAILYILRTTSKPSPLRPSLKGCYSDYRGVFKLDANQSNSFPLNTWIQFEIFDLKFSDFQKAFQAKRITSNGKLEDDIYSDLMNCLKCHEDIPTKYLSKLW